MNEYSRSFSVLFGDSLNKKVPVIQLADSTKMPDVILNGPDGFGYFARFPIDSNILSKHIMLLGGIGTGKTNAFFQIVNQPGGKLSDEDVMIIFDTKGDFYHEFYTPGDIVISNDSTATGSDELDYWNIYNEI